LFNKKSDTGHTHTKANITDFTHSHAISDITNLQTTLDGKASSKKYATFVVGNSAAGHKASDVDYLCTGTNDQTIINNAITALPSIGGKIIILEGTYNCGGSINVNKDNITLEGMGASTILNATTSITSSTSGLISLTGNYCKINDLKLKCNSTSINVSDSIYIGGTNNVISSNICSTSNYSAGSFGIYVAGNNNSITSNICTNNNGPSSTYDSTGIYINGSNNTVTGNICSNRSNIPNNNSYSSKGIDISTQGINNTISSNILYNDSSGRSFGISISGKNNTIIGNTVANNSNSNSGNTSDNCYGIFIGSGSNIISNNIIANKKGTGQSTSNTFAIYMAVTGVTYCSIIGNNLRGVTGASSPGSAFTQNGSAASQLPGTSGTPTASTTTTTIAALNTSGLCGFNIV
jgi:hypothetical protein